MKLIQAFVENPVKVTVGALMVALFGLVSLTRMPMQLTPEVQTPTLTIETRWPGASPQEVEQEITIEQEEQLKGVEGVTEMSSESADSQSTIMLEFQVGTNMEEALLKVNSRLQQVREYPADADEPVITTANVEDRPIAWFILSPRIPSKEQFTALATEHPPLAAALEDARRAHNPSLVMLRLRRLAAKHPEVSRLLPPDDLKVAELQRFAEDEIEARFERVAGVSQSNVLGGLEDELQVIVDPEALAARGLTLSDVRRVLQAQNADTSAGDLWEGKRRWVVRAKGQFRSPAHVENQLLTVIDGAPVFVRDVAEVRLGFKKPTGLVRKFGEQSIAINCLRETGANVLDVMAGLQTTAADIDRNVLRPRGLQLVQVYDETEYIDSSIRLVRQNIFIGGALTMVVLMFFLHLGIRTLIVAPLIIATALAAAYLSAWFFVICIAIIVTAGFTFARGSLVVALAIPTSLVASFLVMGVLGRSLNVISLAGLAFAVGMLVDNAVVVLENIYRRHRLGESAVTAAVRGTQEVWGAVAASTITTVAVFLPIVFVQEEAGQLFRDIALAISAAVVLSLVVSMTVIPTAAARLFSRGEAADPGLDSRAASRSVRDRVSAAAAVPPRPTEMNVGRGHRWWSRISRWPAMAVAPLQRAGALFTGLVVAVNRWIQQGTLRRLLTATTMVSLALGLSWMLWPKVEYLPSGNRNLVFGILIPPPGYNLDQMTAIGETVERSLLPYFDVTPGSEAAENLPYPVIDDFFFVARGRQVFTGIRAHDPQRAAEYIPLIQQAAEQIPGAFVVAKQSSLFEQGLSAGRTVEIEIAGPDLTHLVRLGGQTMGKVRELMPTAQARPIPSLDLSTPEIHIDPKLVQAAQMGVTSQELGFTVNALVDGAYAGDYYLDGKKIDLTIIGLSHFADATHQVAALPVATPNGQLVPLTAIAEVSLASGPEQINHRERVRAVTIEVSPPPEIALEDAIDQINREIVQPLRASGQLDGGYQVTLAGTADKLANMQATFFGDWTGWNYDSLISVLTSQFVLVILITYLLMAALFESWLYPLVIILSVPLGAVGGIAGLQALNLYLQATGQLTQQLDVLTMLGFVILVGTVVNNPILIIHQSLNHVRDDAMSPRQAILESVRTRIRPIFMTTLTTLLGLAPLVLFPGAGSELYRGLGSVVLGGLLISTLFTLVLVPTLFSLLMDMRSRLAGGPIEIGTDAVDAEGPDWRLAPTGEEHSPDPRDPSAAKPVRVS